MKATQKIMLSFVLLAALTGCKEDEVSAPETKATGNCTRETFDQCTEQQKQIIKMSGDSLNKK